MLTRTAVFEIMRSAQTMSLEQQEVFSHLINEEIVRRKREEPQNYIDANEIFKFGQTIKATV